MSSPNPAAHSADLAANEFETTDAEKAALAAEGTTPPAAAEGAPAEAVTPPAGEGAAAPAAAAAKDTAAPAEGVPAAAAPAADVGAEIPVAPATPFVPQYTSDSRDFDAELSDVSTKLKELKDKHGAGDVEDDAYEAEYERLQDLKTDIRIAKSTAQTRQEINQQTADQSWAYLQNQFFGDSANAAIRASGMRFAAWEAAMQDVVNEEAAAGRQITDWDLMHKAKAKMVSDGLLPATTTPAPQAAPAATTTQGPGPKPDRTPPMGNVPATLATAPSAAEPGTRGTSDQLADIADIEDIEERMANMSEAQRDAVLRGTPGAYLG